MSILADTGPRVTSPGPQAILAFADELAERPELLAGLEQSVRDRSVTSLIVLPGGWSPERVGAEVPQLLSGLDLDDEDPLAADVLVVTGPVTDSDQAMLAGRCQAIYGATPVGAELALLPRLDVATLGAPSDVAEPSPAATGPAGLAALRQADARPTVRSFDVFDTLIARRCVEPLAVFDLVGARTGVQDFAVLRRRAEQNLLSGTYTLDDIYVELGRLSDLDETTLAQLRATELAIELEQVIPIAENLAEVRHGDLLVSDMYLPAETIRDLLTAAGLDRRVGLVVSNHGKARGTIWPQLLERFRIERHTGDNPHADINGATHFGISTHMTATHAPNPVELLLARRGLRRLAALSRELRLAAWSPEPLIHSLQTVQADLNVPLLAISSVLLVRLSAQLQRPRMLFSSRDCYQWVPLFSRIAQALDADVDAEYFYTSRVTRTKPSESYLQYASSRMTPDSIVVDICGTGWSLAQLARTLELTDYPALILHHTPPSAHYDRIERMPDTLDFHSVVDRRAYDVDNVLFEMSNFADHGMVTDVEMVLGQPMPILAHDERGELEMRAVQAQLAVARHGAEALNADVAAELDAMSDDALRKVFNELYRILACQSAPFAIYMPNFLAENQRVNTSIDRLSPTGPQPSAAPSLVV